MHSSTTSTPRSPQGISAGVACDENDRRAVVDADRVVALGRDVGAPAALHAVELQQVRGGRGAALELVEVDHVQAVAARAGRPSGRSAAPIAARSARRPMRPMPLMPTFIVRIPLMN